MENVEPKDIMDYMHTELKDLLSKSRICYLKIFKEFILPDSEKPEDVSDRPQNKCVFGDLSIEQSRHKLVSIQLELLELFYSCTMYAELMFENHEFINYIRDIQAIIADSGLNIIMTELPKKKE